MDDVIAVTFLKIRKDTLRLSVDKNRNLEISIAPTATFRHNSNFMPYLKYKINRNEVKMIANVLSDIDKSTL